MFVAKIHNSYSFFDKIELAWFLLRTKLICRSVRIMRFPLVIRGRRLINFGRGLTTGYWCRFEAFATDQDRDGCKILFGNNIQVNDFVHISALERVSIGDNTLMASHVYISDNSHGFYKGKTGDTPPDIDPASRPYFVAPVSIGANVLIG